MNKQQQHFFEKTKQLHIILSIVLLLILVVMVAPIGIGIIKYTGQAVIIVLLIYILFKNLTETHNFVLVQKETKKNIAKKRKEGKKEEDINEDIMIDMKNNTIASYILCGFILILLVYVIYSFFNSIIL
jgi:hypothetical protein